MTRSTNRLRPMLAAAALLLGAAGAQAQPMVQALPDPAALRLNEALRILAQDPRSLTGLLAAGQASLALDDVEAALGFFRRAEAVAPDHGGVRAGFASVAALQGQPIEALRLFAEAEAAGEPMAAHASERGLAYDLVGDNQRAQEEYRIALAQGGDALVSRRLAISQAISGDQRGSDATLLPMLQRNDLAAFRTRAFALAILGKTEEAVSIAETMLPERLSSRMGPYLRYMPRLTRAQQAAAANLGTFPRAAQIGRDDPELAAYSPQLGPPQPARTADSRLVPSGEPLGRREEGGIPRREPPSEAVAVEPPRQEAIAAEARSEPPVVLVSATEPPAAQPVVVERAEPPAAAAPEPEKAVSLSEAFAGFSLPPSTTEPAAGAVDITTIQPRRESPRPPAPPPKPVVPSREWVQVATGRDVAALEFDWRRIKRAAGGLLDRYEPHIADWGQTNRLLAGPFASAREAQQFVGRLKEKQIDSFRFTSARGQEVEPLD